MRMIYIFAAMILASARADDVPLKWRAVEADSIGYRVAWGSASGLYTGFQIVPWIYETNCVVTIDGGQRQYFSVRAIGPNEDSDYSTELAWDPRLRIVIERDGGDSWLPVTTNTVTAFGQSGTFRLRIER